MPEKNWEVVETVLGDLQAEMLRGLLEAQGVPAILSQEGAGHSVFPVNVGKLGEVQILVPADRLEEARTILEDYNAGNFSDPSDSGEGDNPEEDR